jgi:hypothetical protein
MFGGTGGDRGFSLRVLRFEYLIKNEHVQILRVNIEIFHGF